MLTGTTDGNDLPSNQEVGYAKESLINRVIFHLALELERLHESGFVGQDNQTSTVNKLRDAAIRNRNSKVEVSFSTEATLFAEKELRDLLKRAASKPSGDLEGGFGNNVKDDCLETGDDVDQDQTDPEGLKRLRESRNRYIRKQMANGYEAACNWALMKTGYDEDRYEELKRLSDWYSSIDENARDAIFNDEQSAWTVAETCYFAIHPEDDGERNEAENFWSQFESGGHPDAEFVKAFVRTAIDLFREV